MAKTILHDGEIREKMIRGVDAVADTVKITLGPKGRNVMLDRAQDRMPLVTNDGVSIAEEIKLKDEFEDMGAKLVRQAASTANEGAGDGTTTATLLTQILVHEGARNIAAGADPLDIQRGMNKATAVAVEELKKAAIPANTQEDLRRVAEISAEDSEIGDLVAKAIDVAGMDGLVNLDDSNTAETTLEVISGTTFDKGMISPYMATDPATGVAELENPYILLTDKKIAAINEIYNLIIAALKEHRPLLIVADGLEDAALQVLVQNKLQGGGDIVAVTPPGFGDMRTARLKDLSLLTGATFLTKDLGYDLAQATVQDLGTAEKIVVTKDSTLITGAKGDSAAVEQTKAYLKSAIAEETSEFEKDRFRQRLAALAGGVATIKVGAFSEAEAKEKKLRIEDALNAARAAMAEGIVAGGGVALTSISPAVKAFAETLEGDQRTGAMAVVRALEEPIRQIATNAGYDASVVVNRVKNESSEMGLNAATGEYVNLLEAGIVDPVKVTRLALECATSVAGTLLTMNAAVTDSFDYGE